MSRCFFQESSSDIRKIGPFLWKLETIKGPLPCLSKLVETENA